MLDDRMDTHDFQATSSILGVTAAVVGHKVSLQSLKYETIPQPFDTWKHVESCLHNICTA